jgi:hypothetical protein
MTAEGPTTEGNKSDARGRLRQLETWSGRATILILLGIVGDIAIPFFFPHETISIPERWSQVFANALIGVGLIVEYLCIVQTISATSAEQTESDQRVANAEANAAEANRAAQEARLELARLTTPRSLTEAQVRVLIAAASPFAGMPFDVWVQPEAEPLDLAVQIADALVSAGWNWLPVDSVIAFTKPNKPSMGIAAAKGVAIEMHHSKRVEWDAPALAVGNAIHWAAIKTEVNETTDASMSPVVLHVCIGAKF